MGELRLYVYGIILVFLSLFFGVGLHAVDLMLNLCINASERGFSCYDVVDQNLFLEWSFKDAYLMGLSLLIASYSLMAVTSILFAYYYVRERLGRNFL